MFEKSDVGQSVASKVCGGCGQPVDDSMAVGKLYWCDWAYRKVPVRIVRTPIWITVGADGEHTPRGRA